MSVEEDDVVVWYRMCDADRELFGGPEWLKFDVAALYDAPAAVLEAYERELGFSLFRLLTELESFSARSTRGALWIALKDAGVDYLDYATFDPKPLRAKRRNEPEPEGNPDADEAGLVDSSDGSKVEA